MQNAIEILKGDYDIYLKDFNSIIFLTYKPFGRGNKDDSIQSKDKLLKFLNLIDSPMTNLKIGFDACFIPLLLKKTQTDSDLIDSCECGFFSVYIDEKLNVMPCSFCNQNKFSFNLKQIHFDEIWTERFNDYKKHIGEYGLVNCDECDKTDECRGKCPFFEELFLCDLVK